MVVVVVTEEEVWKERLKPSLKPAMNSFWGEAGLWALSLPIWLKRASPGNSCPESSLEVGSQVGLHQPRSQSSSQEGGESEGASTGISYTPGVMRSALCPL